MPPVLGLCTYPTRRRLARRWIGINLCAFLGRPLHVHFQNTMTPVSHCHLPLAPQADEVGKLLDLSSMVWEDLQLRWYEINKVRAGVIAKREETVEAGCGVGARGTLPGA